MAELMRPMNGNDEENRNDYGKLLKIGGGGLLFLWGAMIPVVFVLVACGHHEQIGTFGDAFGVLNALVGILGFGAVIHTLKKQEDAGEEEKARHADILNLQKDSLVIQNKNLELEQRMLQERVVSTAAQNELTYNQIVTSNLEINRAIQAGILADNEKNQQFIYKYGSILIGMQTAGSGVTFIDYSSRSYNSVETDEFFLACNKILAGFGSHLKVAGDSAEEANRIISSWRNIGEGIHRDEKKASASVQHWMKKMMEKADPELKELLANL